VFCFDESDAYRVLASRSFETPIGQRLVGFKVPRWAEQLDAVILGDFGLPYEAQQIYDRQKILFLVRDYRDAMSSMMKLRGQRSWLEDWAEPIINAHVQQDRGFAERWLRELEIVHSAAKPLIGIAALYWKYKNAALLRYRECGYPVLAVCYERLVTQPAQELRRVCGFLEIDFTEEILHHPRHPHREIDSNGLAIGDTDPGRSIDAESVGQWPKFLDTQDIKLAEEIIGSVPVLLAAHFD